RRGRGGRRSGMSVLRLELQVHVAIALGIRTRLGIHWRRLGQVRLAWQLAHRIRSRPPTPESGLYSATLPYVCLGPNCPAAPSLPPSSAALAKAAEPK